ncbi:MAG: adenylyl-sulfate kinase [Patescibacteria group bacterium]|nr:adenylyl-sulfate kinase [Patescibacteria group bacterium]
MILEDVEIYPFDKREYAEKVFGTTSLEHPGVSELFKQGDYLLGGKVINIINENKIYLEYNLSPKETKEEFKKRNWGTVVAFQTRNVPHQGHVFLQKEALKITDGLFIQPVIGEKKLNDFKDEYIISSYDLLIKNNHYDNKAMLGVLPLKMRYAGPREAVMHALIRRNYACTHFIVGRDHAGVGDFYHPKVAQKIFDQFDKKELGIEIIKFAEAGYCPKQEKHIFIDENKNNDTIKFSGTKLRKYIKNKKRPPKYLIHKIVYDFLINSTNPLIDDMTKKNKNNKGFILWFTGLSAAGKTTIADAVYEELNNNGVRLERLDGDIVRENLSKGLGFDRAGREENIRRIGFVANLLSKNGVGVMASFITPYQEMRSQLRKNVHNYIEIFMDAPLSVCESRDPKGMYKEARAGNRPGFTGIDDPFDKPKKPDIHIKSSELSVEESVQKIIKYLQDNEIVVK